MQIILTLPFPPSSNMLFPTSFKTGKRYKSGAYKVWENLAAVAMLNQKKYSVDGTEFLKATYIHYSRWMTKKDTILKKDVANYEKALTDFLGTQIKGFDDSQIFKFETEKVHSDRNETEIIIEEI